MMFWVYKLTYDSGAAPHVRDDLLSLAICKPLIRGGAALGDWIFGFGGRSRVAIGGERLIYVARVTKKLSRPGEYYERSEYRDRWDCIYDRMGDCLAWRPGSLFHENGTCVDTDLGAAPLYPRAVVLLSEDFRYLGAEGTLDYRTQWPDLGTYIHELGRGHRKVDPASKEGRLLVELQRENWASRSAGSSGEPTEPVKDTPAWRNGWGAARAKPAGRTCAPRST